MFPSDILGFKAMPHFEHQKRGKEKELKESVLQVTKLTSSSGFKKITKQIAAKRRRIERL